MARPPILTVAPAEYPVTLAEAKAHLRVDHSGDDTRINRLIAAATGHLDGWSGIMGRCIISQTWRQDFDCWAEKMRLPFPDASSVSVAYFDTEEAQQTFASSNYDVLTDERGPYVALKAGKSWPSLGDVVPPIRITAVYGFGAASAVPDAVKHAILLHVEQLFDIRAVDVDQFEAARLALVTPLRRIVL